MAESQHDIDLLIERLMALYEAGEHKAVSLLANWYRQMSVHKRVPPDAYGLLEQEFRSKEEIRSMIVEAIRKEEEMIRQASKAEGIAEGIAKGKAEQQRLLVRRMVAKGYALAVIADLLMLSEAVVQALIGDDAQDGK